MSSLTVDFDDFGANHIISDQCQSHDCRDKLDQLHYANGAFKATLFAIPAEMTYELLEWCKANENWIELAVHGFYHRDNWEASKWTYEDMGNYMSKVDTSIGGSFVKGFKAPGWQISDYCYNWLLDNGWWVADQSYNNSRRPKQLAAYVNNDGSFEAVLANGMGASRVEAWHGHTWDCVGNGIYQTYDQVEQLVKDATEFKFVSEVLQ